MSYRLAQEAFEQLCDRCRKATAGDLPATEITEEEATQLAEWIVSSLSGNISDRTLAAIVRAKRKC